ncbi:MAG: hypothetical protein EA396_05455 [Anaerolineaceae bacterium]|nr:MAG: hypothetical protein EA396_05455 [Anaerolineaceae bacterium]
MLELNAAQRRIASADDKTFVRGMAGTGKTTAAVERLREWLRSGIPASSITVLLPQQTLALPYQNALTDADLPPNGGVLMTTFGSIAKRAVELFWPLVPDDYGFGQPHEKPVFLTLETAQYFMARVAGPEIDKNGYFDTITIERNRLYSQIIDNLNKAAVIDGIHYTQIAGRLKSAWIGNDDQKRMYDDVQTCANLFRDYCLRYNLLDFSLQVEVFKVLWRSDVVRAWVFDSARYIIADNTEEDTPLAHDVLAQMVTHAESALLIYDEDAGYRQFLGADDLHALEILRPTCATEITLTESHVNSAEVADLGAALAASLDHPAPPSTGAGADALHYEAFRYHPQMIDGAVAEVVRLVHDEGVHPAEIVILSAYVSDALRFSVMNRLEDAGVPVRSHRPSRPLRQEPATRTLLTLARLAHPRWHMPPTAFDVAYALRQGIHGLDLVRAQLLARAAYSVRDGLPRLAPFEKLNPTLQERCTFVMGERYERLRGWLASSGGDDDEAAPLDHFFSRLFGELLSQPGFGFQDGSAIPNKDAATVTANLIDSARKFRQMVDESGATITGKTAAQEYVEMVEAGVIADQYPGAWHGEDDSGAVLIAPAYTYLLSNHAVDFQFWLNIGGAGWAERIYQPLTNPFVLSRRWPEGMVWTDAHEEDAARVALSRLTLGLLRRCRRGVYLALSELSEQGYEQRGDLLLTFQRVLRGWSADSA